MTKRQERFHNKKRTELALKIDRSSKIREKELNKTFKKLIIKIINNPMKKAIESYIQNINIDKSCNYEYFSNNKEFTKRIFLNYIRHNYSNYYNLLCQINNLNNEEINNIKERTNKLILRKYKDLI